MTTCQLYVMLLQYCTYGVAVLYVLVLCVHLPVTASFLCLKAFEEKQKNIVVHIGQ